jgi:hypothetical protein
MHIHFPFIDIIHLICVALQVFVIKNGDYIAQNVSNTTIIICCCQLTDPFLCLQNMIEVFNSKMHNT